MLLLYYNSSFTEASKCTTVHMTPQHKFHTITVINEITSMPVHKKTQV